jgi:hypothetical protein
MTPPALPTLEFDSFSTAAGGSIITGAFSVIAPFLTALTETLVVLAVAAWVAILRQQRSSWRDAVRPGRVVALATLGLGGAFFLLPAPVPGGLHGLVLPITLVPLWLVERVRPRGLPAPRTAL